MPFYSYKCPKCNTKKDLDLRMGHDIPTNADWEECKEAGCPKEIELQRIWTAPGVTWKCGRPTDTTSATREKNAKLKKLYNDSYVGMENYDKPPKKKKEE